MWQGDDRYRQLHLNAALKRRCDYARACKELTEILRSVYLNSSKPVQRAMEEDILTVIHLIPGMDTVEQLATTRELLAVVKAVLPKKRRAVVLTASKQALIAQSRELRSKENDRHDLKYDFSQLPTDVLLHIFGIVDPLTLTKCSAVCWSWHDTAKDESLWQTYYKYFYDDYDSVLRKSLTESSSSDLFKTDGGHGLWRSTFVRNIKKQAPRKRRLKPTNRVLCTGCKSLYWSSETAKDQANSEFCVHGQHRTRPVHLFEVVDSLRPEKHSSSSSSNSESEDDGDKTSLPRGRRLHRMWAMTPNEVAHKHNLHGGRDGVST